MGEHIAELEAQIKNYQIKISSQERDIDCLEVERDSWREDCNLWRNKAKRFEKEIE